MSRGLPKWFRALFVAVMLLTCAMVVTQVIRQVQLQDQIADLQLKVETTQKRLAKQQMEYDAYTAELPVVLAELETAEPAAAEAAAKADALKEQRKQLRAENAELAAALEELKTQAEAGLADEDSSTLNKSVDEAIAFLDAALTQLAE